MDPVTAAGIGLSISSLVLQVFAGCIKGYQLFAEADGMPVSYHHHRVRLRIEQARLLNWGEKVGLVEELLDRPSQVLRLNQNLVLDILLEVQKLFKGCVKVGRKYDALVPEQSDHSDTVTADSRFPRGTNRILIKTLGLLEKVPRVSKRLQWAMVEQEQFAALIEKLIGYNDSIESLLDRNALDQLQWMQHQTHMVMLQLTSKVDELKTLSLAIRLPRQTAQAGLFFPLSRSSTLVADQQEYQSFATLADFKYQQTAIEQEVLHSKLAPLERSEVQIERKAATRPEATWRGKPAWIEWKRYQEHPTSDSLWNKTIEDRVRKLATLLCSRHKPREFRAPLCLGYFHDRDPDDDSARYGFVYEKPLTASAATEPISLLDLLAMPMQPSLTKRVALAGAVAESLMYLHSVNWLHKGFRSENIIFFPPPEKAVQVDYDAPILSGFDYARPDLAGEITEKPLGNIEWDLYRHPDQVTSASSTSKRSHDIYSLGIVLMEIAYWQPISDILEIDLKQKGARTKIGKSRARLLSDEERFLDTLGGRAGESYREVVHKCISGGSALGTHENADEMQVSIGAEMQRVFSSEIVGRLRSLNL